MKLKRFLAFVEDEYEAGFSLVAHSDDLQSAIDQAKLRSVAIGDNVKQPDGKYKWIWRALTRQQVEERIADLRHPTWNVLDTERGVWIARDGTESEEMLEFTELSFKEAL